MTNKTKGTIPTALLIFLLTGFLGFGAQWVTIRKAVADHIAEASIHQPTDVLVAQGKAMKQDMKDLKDSSDRRWTTQNTVNLKVLGALGKIQGRLGIEE